MDGERVLLPKGAPCCAQRALVWSKNIIFGQTARSAEFFFLLLFWPNPAAKRLEFFLFSFILAKTARSAEFFWLLFSLPPDCYNVKVLC